MRNEDEARAIGRPVPERPRESTSVGTSSALRFLSVAVYGLVIWVLLSIPTDFIRPSGRSWLPEWLNFGLGDKVVHAVLFFTFAWLSEWALRARSGPGKGEAETTLGRALPGRLLWAIGVSTVYGGLTEVYQLSLPFRSGEMADFIADLAGAVAYGIFWWLRRDRSSMASSLSSGGGGAGLR